MSEKVSNSIKFLLDEYARLLKKKENSKLTHSEEETLKSLIIFLGKKNEF